MDADPGDVVPRTRTILEVVRQGHQDGTQSVALPELRGWPVERYVAQMRRSHRVACGSPPTSEPCDDALSPWDILRCRTSAASHWLKS